MAAIALPLFFASCDNRSAIDLLTEKGVDISGSSLLAHVQTNQTHLVRLLSEANVSPDSAVDKNGQSALIIAARHGYSEALELILPQAKNLELADSRGMTALSHAICNGNSDLAKELLKAGASPDAKCPDGQPLIVSSLIRSDLPTTQLLLAHGAKAGLDDALLIAVTERKFDFVKALVAAGANVDTGADFGMPVLNVAMQNSDKNCFELLLEAGANPNVLDDEASSAFGYAISDGDTMVVSKFLKQSAKVESPCFQDENALEYAIIKKVPSVVKLLVTEGKSQIRPSIVTKAIDHGSSAVLEVLLDHGADINTPDSHGDTLLARAVRSGDPSQVELLIQRGAKADSMCREGQPLIALATALRRPDCIATLIKNGADPNVRLKDPISDEYRALVDSKVFSYYSKRDKRFTPLMVAASHGHGDTIRALKQNGASTSHYTRGWKRYPISFASEAKHIEAQQLIVGYDPKKRKDAYKIVIDLSKQRAVMYKNGAVHMSSRVSTGKSGYRTPTGSYVVTHKHRTHTSNLYNSPMPYFMRFSCQAFGTHVGYVPNYPASHGCIRMPHSGARAFFNAAPRGTPVSIVN